MALFTDGLIADLPDLRDYESAVLDVAGTEQIDLAAKLEIAQREIGIELTAFLVRKGVPLGPQRELSTVVVTEPLLHLHALQTLALVYRDAYNRQLNDRYLGKWKEYERLAERSLRKLLDVGVGITSSPVPRAPQPTLSHVAGGLLPSRTYHVSLAIAGFNGRTGAWSRTASIELPPGTRMSTLPPATSGPSNGLWIYAGQNESQLTRQNDVPLQPGTAWVEPVSGLRTNLAALPVQMADFYSANRRELLRG